MSERRFSFGLSDNCHKWGLKLDEKTRELVQQRFRKEIIGLFRDAGIFWHLDLVTIGVQNHVDDLYKISTEQLVPIVGHWMDRLNRTLKASRAWKRGELSAEPIDGYQADKPIDWACCNFQGNTWKACEAFVLHEKVGGKIRDFEIQVPTSPTPDPKGGDRIRIPVYLMVQWECDTGSTDGYPKP